MSMRSFILVCLFCGLALPLSAAEVDVVRVFLIGGQSNADGRVGAEDLPVGPVNLQEPQEDVDFFVSGSLTTLRPMARFGPEISLGRELANRIGGGGRERVAIVKYAVGGTCLARDWRAGGDGTTSGDGPQYVAFQQAVEGGLAALAEAHPAAAIHIEGMLWVQGERDVRTGAHEEYADRLAAFIADLRATFGAELPFVISRLSVRQTDLDSVQLEVVREAQAAVAEADPLTALLDTDEFGMESDNLHFNVDGRLALGRAAAEILWEFVPASRTP